MLSSLEKDLLIEFLSTRVPNTSKSEIISSVEKAESVVSQAIHLTNTDHNLPVINNEKGIKIGGGGAISIPGISGSGQLGIEIEVHEGGILNIHPTNGEHSLSGVNLPVINNEKGIKIGGGGGMSIPGISGSGQLAIEIEVHEGGILNIHPTNGEHSLSGVNLPVINNEKGFLKVIEDSLKGIAKPSCQALAAGIYNTAVAAANTLDPIGKAAALVIAKAAYDKAMNQC
ncbi:hypothetical protein [Bacillus thuringiensis]|uniref:hypothetical protein n=1 Tax=Bacillus thuringiensis TaxID=1428 RepID=UPI002FFFD947